MPKSRHFTYLLNIDIYIYIYRDIFLKYCIEIDSVDSVCTVCLCISDCICSLLHTCSVCFVVAASYPFFVGIRGNVVHFFRAWGNTTHFQNELKETLPNQ